MSTARFTVEQFRALTLDALGFLETKGFHRTAGLEQTTPTSGTVVYLGKHVGFVFSLDVRDQCVDAQVVKVHDGQMKRSWEGGYSSDVLAHLVRHAGYRGSAGGSTAAQEPALERMVKGWAELLRQAGQALLADRPDSLPS